MRIRALRTIVGDYGRLEKGNVGDIPDAIAQRLVKRGSVVVVQPPVTEVQSDGLAPLREEFEALTGQRPHHLWKEARLRSEIDKAKGA